MINGFPFLWDILVPELRPCLPFFSSYWMVGAGSEWWRSAVGRPWVVVVRVCRPE